MHIWHIHHPHIYVAKGVEDSDLAMSKDKLGFFYTVNEENGVILATEEKHRAKKQTGLRSGERSWYFYAFIHIQ